MLELSTVNTIEDVEYDIYKPSCSALIFYPKKATQKRIGLFLFNAGHRNKTGPNDVYSKIGSTLAHAGIAVIIPDPENSGEFFNGFKYETIPEHFEKIHKGLNVTDAIESIEYFKNKLKLDYIVLSGLCGGTLTSMHVASRIKVDGVLAWACPFQIANRPMLPLKDTNDEKNEGVHKEKKINTKNKFVKILKGDIDWKFHRHKLHNRVFKILGKHPSFDYQLLKNIKIVNRKTRLEFIFSQQDRHYEVFKRYFLEKYDTKQTFASRTNVIENSNHALGDDRRVRMFCDLAIDFCFRISKC